MITFCKESSTVGSQRFESNTELRNFFLVNYEVNQVTGQKAISMILRLSIFGFLEVLMSELQTLTLSP